MFQYVIDVDGRDFRWGDKHDGRGGIQSECRLETLRRPFETHVGILKLGSGI